MPIPQKQWTKLLTNADSPFTIREEWGLCKFSLTCTSATAISFKGNVTVGGHASEDYPLIQNESFSWSDDTPVSDFVITIPAGATAKIAAFI